MDIRYPIYILSKGRPNGSTARIFNKYNIPYKIVIEKEDYKDYLKENSKESIIVLPESNMGPCYVRNFILTHSRCATDYTWQFDDNIKGFYGKNNGKRTKLNPIIAINEVELILKRYINIGVIGFNLRTYTHQKCSRFNFNTRIYSAFCIKTDTNINFQGSYNLDNDICIQFLLKGYCTVQLNYHTICKGKTGDIKGGNYERYKGKGRYIMAYEIKLRYPNFTKVIIEKNRHQIRVDWSVFKNNKLIEAK